MHATWRGNGSWRIIRKGIIHLLFTSTTLPYDYCLFDKNSGNHKNVTGIIAAAWQHRWWQQHFCVKFDFPVMIMQETVWGFAFGVLHWTNCPVVTNARGSTASMDSGLLSRTTSWHHHHPRCEQQPNVERYTCTAAMSKQCAQVKARVYRQPHPRRRAVLFAHRNNSKKTAVVDCDCIRCIAWRNIMYKRNSSETAALVVVVLSLHHQSLTTSRHMVGVDLAVWIMGSRNNNNNAKNEPSVPAVSNHSPKASVIEPFFPSESKRLCQANERKPLLSRNANREMLDCLILVLSRQGRCHMVLLLWNNLVKGKSSSLIGSFTPGNDTSSCATSLRSGTLPTRIQRRSMSYYQQIEPSDSLFLWVSMMLSLQDEPIKSSLLTTSVTKRR